VNVLSGIEDYLLQVGYLYLVVSHRFRHDLIDDYVELFLHRSVDGLIAINTPWHRRLKIPVATVSSHHAVEGVTRILLDHHRAVEIALKYLMDLGHRKIAFIKGQAFVPDTAVRWSAIMDVAGKLGLEISPNLVGQIEDNSPSPHLGYRVTQQLLASGEDFTALFAFNDICAMGAIRALYECGRKVPRDVSVMGFDDIESSSYQTRSLTTVRQPLRDMGKIAAEIVLRRVQNPDGADGAADIVVRPELIERETTAPVSRDRKSSRPTLVRG
jgi:LacI family transcriptional regulator